MTETVADLRMEIREVLGVPESWAASSSLRSRTLTKAAKAIGVDHPHGSGPMTRKAIRQQLAEREREDELVGHQADAKPLRKDELRQLRDALQEVSTGDD